MRDPWKSSKTASVKARVDDINRMLYEQTNDMSSEVMLGIGDDRIFVLCYRNGVARVIYECLTVKHLYKVLDSILFDIVYENRPEVSWWKWNDINEDS